MGACYGGLWSGYLIGEAGGLYGGGDDMADP